MPGDAPSPLTIDPDLSIHTIAAADLGDAVPGDWNSVSQVRTVLDAVFPSLPRTESDHPDALFRVDRDLDRPNDGAAVRLVVQTTHRPAEGTVASSVPVAGVLEGLERGEVVSFRIVVNAVQTAAQPKPEEGRGPRGVRTAVPLRPEEDFPEFREWFARLLERSGGFEEVICEVIAPRRYSLAMERRRGGGRRKWIDAVAVVGTARVAEVDAARELVLEGVGRSRIAGCGLLTISR